MDTTARALNGRVRKAHVDTKAQERFGEVERHAAGRDQRLLPLPSKPDPGAQKLVAELKKKNPGLRTASKERTGGTGYSIVERPISTMEFYQPVYDGDRVVLLINPEHPFYKQVYGPLVESDSSDDKALRAKIELFLLAAARAEASVEGIKNRDAIAKFRLEWSNALATFLDG